MSDSWSDGEAYERYVGRWSSRIGELFLDRLAARPGARWLDIGCGTGALSERIHATQAPSRLIGVEPSEGFRAVARERVQGGSVEFRGGSAETLPVADASIDYAVSGLALNFVQDRDAAMREQLRVLAPGGTAASYVWDYAGHAQFMRCFWDAAVKLSPKARELDEGVRFPICRPGPLRDLFERAGFRGVRVDPLDIPTPFESFEDYWRPFLNDVGPAPGYCSGLPAEQRRELEALLRDALPTDPDGMILLAARAWAVSGVRAD